MAPPKTATRTLYNNNNETMDKSPFFTLSHDYDDSPLYHNQYHNTNTHNQHYLTIEELRSERNSCWLCGCNWQQDHVSLDCPVCDGYALSRPCPKCEGECKQVWKREINNSTHDRHRKASSWVGYCDKNNREHNNKNKNDQTTKQQLTDTTGELKDIYMMALVR